MKISRLTAIFILAASFAAAVSCKKDEETQALPSLEGSISFYAPQFIEPGATITLTPKGAVHPEGDGVGIYWKVSPVMTSGDTTRFENGLNHAGQESDGTFTYTFPDSLGVYTVLCYAYADGYTGLSSSKYVTTVEPGLNGSLSMTGILPKDEHITIDGQDYYYTRIGELDWFRNNLANRSGGMPYANADIMTDVFGRFYDYEDAMAACPEGWRLPTEEDWTALATALGTSAEKYGVFKGISPKLMVNATFNKVTMWDYWPEVGNLTNESKFSAIPAGYINLGTEAEDGTYPEADSYGVYQYAAFWTADTVEGEETLAYYRYIVDNQPDVFISKGNKKEFGASVRCVR